MRQFFFIPIATALILSAATTQAKVLIKVDLDAQRLTAIKGDGETAVFKISSGRPGYETPTGRFSVMRMVIDHHSDEYDQAPMPYAMFFSPRGLAIHGSTEKGLGRPASHGCVRLAVPHAQRLYGWVEEEGGANVEITGSGQNLSLHPEVSPTREGPSRPLRSQRRLPDESAKDEVEELWRF